MALDIYLRDGGAGAFDIDLGIVKLTSAMTWADYAMAAGATRTEGDEGGVTLTSAMIWADFEMSMPVLMNPTGLFCDNVTAQDGRSETTGVIDDTPAFSALVTKCAGNLVSYQLQVSGVDDSTFASAMSFDSGWVAFADEITTNQRTPDLIYGVVE